MAAPMTKGHASKKNSAAWIIILTLAFVTAATAAPAFTPPVNTSAFEATAGGALYIGTVYGEDNFVAVVGVANLSACDPAGYASGDAGLWGTVGNLTLDNFPVSVRYACDKLAEPRWMPQVTATGMADGAEEFAGTTATANSFNVQGYKAGRSFISSVSFSMSFRMSFSMSFSLSVVWKTSAQLDVESPPPRPHVCISIHPEGRRDPIFGRVLALFSMTLLEGAGGV